MKIFTPLVFLLFSSFVLISQTGKDFVFQGIIGTKLYTDSYEVTSIDNAWQLKSALSLGVELYYKKWPMLSISYLHDRAYQLYAITNQNPSLAESNLFSSSRGNFLGIYYHRKNLKYGFGHYNNLHENSVNYIFPNETFKKRQIALSCALKSGRMEFELVKLFQYHKLFSVFNIDLQYINVKYKLFNPQNTPMRATYKGDNKTQLTFKIGLRGFPVRNDYLPGENKKRVGSSFQTGMELKFKKINTALFAERDWWLRLNGGSLRREVNGYVINSVLGIKYSLPKLKNTFVSVGYDWTTDHNTINQTWEKIAKGEEKVDLYFYNVKGIALGVGIPVFEKFDLDVRSILPLRGEKIGNPMRFSLGIAYKINP
jgi:hypothetical protein